MNHFCASIRIPSQIFRLFKDKNVQHNDPNFCKRGRKSKSKIEFKATDLTKYAFC